jgi:hypothetical protein
VTRQAVYQGHFGSKAELLLALVDDADSEAGIPGHVRRFLAARDGAEALDLAVDIHAAIEPQIHGLARVFETARLSDAAVEAVWQDRMAARRGVAAAVVRRLAEEGRLAPEWTEASATDFLWSMLSVWTYQALVEERGWALTDYAARLKTSLRAALERS